MLDLKCPELLFIHVFLFPRLRNPLFILVVGNEVVIGATELNDSIGSPS